MRFCTQCGVPVGTPHKRMLPFIRKKQRLADQLKKLNLEKAFEVKLE